MNLFCTSPVSEINGKESRRVATFVWIRSYGTFLIAILTIAKNSDLIIFTFSIFIHASISFNIAFVKPIFMRELEVWENTTNLGYGFNKLQIQYLNIRWCKKWLLYWIFWSMHDILHIDSINCRYNILIYTGRRVIITSVLIHI